MAKYNPTEIESQKVKIDQLEAVVDPLLALLGEGEAAVKLSRDRRSGPFYVEVTDGWTAWTTRQFIGPDLPSALAAAVEVRRQVIDAEEEIPGSQAYQMREAAKAKAEQGVK
jgi:hypothetical protein